MTNTALKTQDLCLSYGSFQAVKNVNLDIAIGERHAIIGPNGAGKTSLVSTLTGTVIPTSGSINLFNEDITKYSQVRRVKSGIARTFQINKLFNNLKVIENIAISLLERDKESSKFWKKFEGNKKILNEAEHYLSMVQLVEYKDKCVKDLSYGQRRLVEIAIALALKPKVLILDEPAAGVPSHQSEKIFEQISELPKDVTLIFIEHDMNLVFKFSEKITVLVAGEVLTQGLPHQIKSDDRVKEVYLGKRSLHA